MAFDPKEVGKKLIVVSVRQITTGKKLEDSAKELRGVAATLNENGRIDRSLVSIENGTRSTRNLLTPISATLHSIVNGLNGISIPVVNFDASSIDFPVVGKVRFITGISILSSRPFQSIASSVDSVADDIDKIRKGLKDIADAVKDLQDELPNIKSRILSGADDMGQGGKELVEAGTAMKEAGTLLTS